MPEPQSADDLYALDPGQFTAARNALAKRWKFQGRSEEAESVATLRRPPLTAWALNQVARHQKNIVEDVLNAGHQLKAAMSQALAGDRTGFAEAREAERVAIDAGVEAAIRCLEEAGHPPGDEARRKMTETLRSAAIDDATAELLQRGALDADKASTGFGFGPMPSLGQEAEGPGKISSNAPNAKAAQKARQRERRRDELMSEIEELREAARAAHRAADEALREADRLSKQATAADDKVTDTRRRLKALDGEV